MADARPYDSVSEGEGEEPPTDGSRAGYRWGLPLVCGVVFLNQFARDFREAATLQVKKEFFGGYGNAAAISGYFDTANVLVDCLTAPVLAGLSDAVGRRKVLLWDVTVAALPNLCLLLRLPFWGYLVTDNLLPGDECVVYALVADLTHKMVAGDRAFCFGALAGAGAAGSLIGYGLHALLPAATPQSTVFAIASAANLTALTLALAMPESLPKEHRRPFQWSNVSPLGVGRFLFQYKGTLAVYFFIYSMLKFAHSGYDTVVDLYNATVFGFHGQKYDQYWLFCTACELLASVGLLRVVSHVFPNQLVLVFGAVVSAVGYAAGGTAASAVQAYAAGFVHACGALWEPALMALVVAGVPPDQEGAIQGALSSVAAMVGFGGPVIAGSIFARTSSFSPGLVWTLPLACALVAGCAALAVVRRVPKPPPVAPSPAASLASLPEDPPGEGPQGPGPCCGEAGDGAGWLAALAVFGLLNLATGIALTLTS